MPTDRGFTGQHTDAVTGLDYYNARYYDPAIGQFSSADLAKDGLNRYAYVGGNPETFTDPSGRVIADSAVQAAFFGGGGLGAVAGEAGGIIAGGAAVAIVVYGAGVTYHAAQGYSMSNASVAVDLDAGLISYHHPRTVLPKPPVGNPAKTTTTPPLVHPKTGPMTKAPGISKTSLPRQVYGGNHPVQLPTRNLAEGILDGWGKLKTLSNGVLKENYASHVLQCDFCGRAFNDMRDARKIIEHAYPRSVAKAWAASQEVFDEYVGDVDNFSVVCNSCNGVKGANTDIDSIHIPGGGVEGWKTSVIEKMKLIAERYGLPFPPPQP